MLEFSVGRLWKKYQKAFSGSRAINGLYYELRETGRRFTQLVSRLLLVHLHALGVVSELALPSPVLS